MSTDPESFSAPKPDLKHELRTYITAIMGYIELFRETFERQAKKKWENGRVPSRLGADLDGGQPLGGSSGRLRTSLGKRVRE